MPRVIISGCNGRMGQVMTRMLEERKIEVVAGFDRQTDKLSTYPVYADPMEYGGDADVIVDFSVPDATDELLKYALQRRLPVVICTTGHSDEQLRNIEEASHTIPVFKSGNMSVGIILMANLMKKVAAVLGGNFDVEIIERHHRMKLDAPSGTAIMLADAVREGLDYEPEYIFERQSVRRQRGEHEIGISSLRGGTIVGEHSVVFAGTDEVLEFRHSAQSREVFANGAVTAALYISEITAPGIYDMNDALSSLL